MGKMAGILRRDGWRYDRMTGEYRKGRVTIERTGTGWARSDSPGQYFETRDDAMGKVTRAPRAPLCELGLFTV